ncbi:MAG TPA: hypothetical protein VJC09_02100 [Candidatus Saccharimonadales bacterium]|nr:hypothetical protein [Candidatus Saccharimonadales bacterium]
MSKKSKKDTAKDGIGIVGMFRVAIDENGRIVSKSDWTKNQITQEGVRKFLVSSLGSISGSSYISYVALGTGTVPSAATTGLPGELAETNGRATVSATTGAGSSQVQFTATFSSSNSFATASRNIANIGLFAVSTQNAGTLFAGNTYASSTVATNQNVNITYNINFSTT